jgi:hypothetical protein
MLENLEINKVLNMVYKKIGTPKEEFEEKNDKVDTTTQILSEFNEKLYKKFKYEEFNESCLILSKSSYSNNISSFSPKSNHTRHSSLFSSKSLRKVKIEI